LETLKRKYGGSLDAVLAARDRFAALLDADAGRDERITQLAVRLTELDRAVEDEADALHRLRVAAARSCEERVAAELAVLAMPAARFRVAIEPLEAIAAHGSDRVEFHFSANPGEPERPLARVASGGERSRVLLALVVALADGRDARAFVFDEIDAGIGGATATAVGARLGRLAAFAQVVCVTHLAQIASYASAHYALRKHDEDGRTTIVVVPLQAEDDRLAEIARMLSGETKGISLEHAATLVASTRSAR
jgi:DNA repair protein RecN (Recombination protein N)